MIVCDKNLRQTTKVQFFITVFFFLKSIKLREKCAGSFFVCFDICIWENKSKRISYFFLIYYKEKWEKKWTYEMA